MHGDPLIGLGHGIRIGQPEQFNPRFRREHLFCGRIDAIDDHFNAIQGISWREAIYAEKLIHAKPA